MKIEDLIKELQVKDNQKQICKTLKIMLFKLYTDAKPEDCLHLEVKIDVPYTRENINKQYEEVEDKVRELAVSTLKKINCSFQSFSQKH